MLSYEDFSCSIWKNYLRKGRQTYKYLETQKLLAIIFQLEKERESSGGWERERERDESCGVCNRYSATCMYRVQYEDNFIVLYRVREICREFILGQLSQWELYDSDVFFSFKRNRGQLFQFPSLQRREFCSALRLIHHVLISSSFILPVLSSPSLWINRCSIIDEKNWRNSTSGWTKLKVLKVTSNSSNSWPQLQARKIVSRSSIILA